MSVVGDASLWSDIFPDWLIPEILDLVISAWVTFDKPQPGDHEVPITMRFRAELVRHKQFRKLPLRIDRETPEDDLLAGQEKGRIDLRFIHGYQEDVYFAFECKRLNVISKDRKRASLAGEYVRAGMMRFITSQYAAGLHQGGMLGYVMDSDVKSSIKAVSQNVKSSATELKLSTEGLLKSSFKPSDENVKETKHLLAERTFVIHHIFLAL